jgi:hypothetical protein
MFTNEAALGYCGAPLPVVYGDAKIAYSLQSDIGLL